MYIRTWRCNNLLSEAGSYLDFSHALLGLAQSAELAFEQGRGGGGVLCNCRHKSVDHGQARARAGTGLKADFSSTSPSPRSPQAGSPLLGLDLAGSP